jgi:hypothetical protein
MCQEQLILSDIVHDILELLIRTKNNPNLNDLKLLARKIFGDIKYNLERNKEKSED